jgi:hypothetical protein
VVDVAVERALGSAKNLRNLTNSRIANQIFTVYPIALARRSPRIDSGSFPAAAPLFSNGLSPHLHSPHRI